MARRLAVLRLCVVLLCAIVLGRLIQLQIVEGARNRELADQNRIRVVRRLAPRGNIYDRRGRLLASSRLAFSINVVPGELRVSEATDSAAGLARLLEMQPEELESRLRQETGSGYEAVPVYRDAGPEIVARVEENLPYLSGVSVLADAARFYPEHGTVAHILGYVREISSDELLQPQNAGYRPLDLIGKAGVEKQAERVLRGRDGGDQIEVDATGRRVRTLGSVRSEPGADVWLTINLDLQRAAEEALGGRPGALVALDPNTGEVLALASSPTYDPNLFVGAIRPEDWDRLSGPDHPQQNRATNSRYPPGSVFKIVTAAAALEAGVTDESDVFQCSGVYRIGSWRLRCWKRAGHGRESFLEGFAQSCNVMFATLGRRVGAGALAEMARRFGLGEKCGLDLPEETEGLIPTPEWKRKARGEPWYPGDTCQMAIGQGDCLATPLQMAREVSVIANGGKLVHPYVIQRIAGETAPPMEPPRPIGLKPSTIATIRKGMKAVVAPGGTATHIASDRYAIAGKTGTAQAPGGLPHAWFGGFAPADNPRIALAVIIEHAGGGSEIAAPIARYVFDAALLPPSERRPWPKKEPEPQQLAHLGDE